MSQHYAPSALYPEKNAVPIAQEAGWAPGPVWTGAKNLAPTGIRSPGRSARSQSLYRLSYRAHKHIVRSKDKLYWISNVFYSSLRMLQGIFSNPQISATYAPYFRRSTYKASSSCLDSREKIALPWQNYSTATAHIKLTHKGGGGSTLVLRVFLKIYFRFQLKCWTLKYLTSSIHKVEKNHHSYALCQWNILCPRACVNFLRLF